MKIRKVPIKCEPTPTARVPVIIIDKKGNYQVMQTGRQTGEGEPAYCYKYLGTRRIKTNRRYEERL